MEDYPKTLKIGTRGSPLALKQTEMVAQAVSEHFPDIEIEVVTIVTSGDWKPADGEARLCVVNGGKGQFAKEIEEALLDGRIDAAVHSMKDMDSVLPEGLVINHMLPREDVRDALLFSNRISNLAEDSQFSDGALSALPEGAVVGTASVRRGAFLLSKRPDLKITPLRGNVRTRINKIRGENAHENLDCTLLAMAGLNRLGFEGEASAILSPEEMLPAAGQGAVGIQINESRDDLVSLFSHISCLKTTVCVKCEREILRVLDGSCHTPIGVYATYENGAMCVDVQVASLDGQHIFKDKGEAEISLESEHAVHDAYDLGHSVGQSIKAKIPPELLNQDAA